jgi:hypothetical protein
MKKFLIVLLLAISCMPASAFDNNDYKAFAEQVKKEVWSKDLPQFKTRQTPAKYKNESAVLLAVYEEVSVDQMHKLSLATSDGIVKQINSTHLMRFLVKIQDKSALNKYSTFDYQTYDRTYNAGFGMDDRRNVLGLKIIKPDGTEKIVNTEEYTTENEGKNGEDKKAKIAVPNLQIGDILDVFVYNQSKVKEENIEPIEFAFINDYPMLDYQIHCVIDPKLCTQYRTLNGAPDFQESKDKEGNVVLDADVKNIDKTQPSYGYNEMSMSPITLLYVTGKVELGYLAKSTKEKGLHANPSAAEIQNDAWNWWQSAITSYNLSKGTQKCLNKAKKLGSDEEKADYLYNFIMMSTFANGKYYVDYRNFPLFFEYLLKKCDVSVDHLLTTDWQTEPLDKLISYSNAAWAIRLKNGKTYYQLPSAVNASTTPSIYQGRLAVVSTGGKSFSKGPFSTITIPVSKAEDNLEKVTMTLNIAGTKANISRHHEYTGNCKQGLIPVFASSDEICKGWGKPYDVASYADLLTDKNAQALAQEAAQKDKENIADNFRKEINDYHDKAPVSVSKTEVTSVGEDNKPLAYTLEYQMDGIIKNAGKNMVVAIGQLIGLQTHIEGKDRTRNCDVLLSIPRTYAVTINLNLPEGYTIDHANLQKLNQNIDNEAASFCSNAEVKQNMLVVNITKVYKKQTIEAAKWPQLLQMLDAAYDFTKQQIVLKKN